MNFIIWNIRGVGNDVSIGRLKLLIKDHSIVCLALLEPKIHVSKLQSICYKLGFSNCLANSSDMAHIWLMWKDPLDFVLVSNDDQQLTVSQVSNVLPAFHSTLVYAKCTAAERQSLWFSLCLLHSQLDGPWLVAGDFNCVLNADEKLGGNHPP